MNDIITIAIVDDHDIFRLGLSLMINTIPYTKVIGDCANGSQIMNLIKQNPPDIIFMDVNLESESGIDVTKKIKCKYPDICIIAITSSDEIKNFKEMIEAGAEGFLLKNIKENELKAAIDSVNSGEMYFSKEFLLFARHFNSTKTTKSKIQISDREKEVLRLICQGNSNQEIADDLILSYHTIDAHRRSLLSKINARNTAEMIMIAFREGLVNVE